MVSWWCGSGSPVGGGDGVGNLDPIGGLSGMRDSGRGTVVGAG